VAQVSSPVEILRTLVGIPSVSAMSNRPIIDAAAQLLTHQEWVCRELPYRDALNTEKVNLIAVPQRQGFADTNIGLAFVCHTDTVPFSAERWPQATTLEEHDGMLYGCGSCDVKGSLSGILAAVCSVNPPQISGTVALVLTADEEIGCVGATHLLAANAIHPRRTIICEPTSLRPASAGKGYGLAEVRILGKEAHSAFPQQGASAIYAAAAMIREIEQAAQNRPASRHELFEPPHTTFNVGTIRGGTAKNILAGECCFLVEWRPVPNEDPQAALRWLQELASGTASSSGCTVKITPLRAEPGFDHSRSSGLSHLLASLLGQPPTGISFGSEATRFARVSEEVVVVGPGNMHTAHSDRECIPVAELFAWTECVSALLRGAVHSSHRPSR
jgi:acetylornithine deacetylase